MKKFLLLLSCVFCLTSCLFSYSSKAHNILYCDFGKPEKTFTTPLKIGKISQAPYISKKMLVREKKGTFSKSDTKFLLGEPNNLLSTYLKFAFSPGNETSCEITANIISLEFTKTEKVALFVVEYKLIKQNKAVNFIFISGANSSEMTLDEVMNSFVNEINQKILELK